jgi:L-fuconolactonase
MSREAPPGASEERIDSHQHFWRYSPEAYSWIGPAMRPIARDFLPDGLAPLLRATGVSATVAVQAVQTPEETDWLLSLAEDYPFIRGVVGWVDLQAPVEHLRAELSRLTAHPRFVGVRHVVQDEPDDWFLRRPAFRRGLAVLEQFDLAYDILIYPRQLPAAIELAAAFPRLRFVLDHLAKPPLKRGELERWASDLETLSRSPNVAAKLSGLVTEADWEHWADAGIDRCLSVAWSCFGPARLMVGSDWPVCTLAAAYDRTLGVVETFLRDAPAEERQAVWGGNARRWYRLTVEGAGAPGE